MPMRVDCKHCASRTYASGETMRLCRLDLAPDAPWRCPDNCPAYERRTGDAGFTVGSLADHPAPEEPESLEGVAALLDDAEDIVNAVGPDVLADVERQREREAEHPSLWRRLFRRH